MILILAGKIDDTRKSLSKLRAIHLAEKLELRNPEEFAPLWVLDFPLLEWDEETKRVSLCIIHLPHQKKMTLKN